MTLTIGSNGCPKGGDVNSPIVWPALCWFDRAGSCSLFSRIEGAQGLGRPEITADQVDNNTTSDVVDVAGAGKGMARANELVELEYQDYNLTAGDISRRYGNSLTEARLMILFSTPIENDRIISIPALRTVK